MLLALAVGLAVVAAVVFGPVPNTRFASASRDLSRFLLIAIAVQTALTVTLMLQLQAVRSALLIAVAALGMALLVEGAEAVRGAAFSFADVGSSLIAVGAGVGLSVARRSRPRRWIGVLAALGFSAVAILPFQGVVASYRARDAAFPTLLDASRGGDIDWVRPQQHAVRIQEVSIPAMGIEEPFFVVPLDGNQEPGIAVDEPYGNWTGLHSLVLEVVNPGSEPLTLVLNVDDMRGSGSPGDRFDLRIQLPPRTRQTIRTDLQDMVRAIPHRRFALEDMDIVRLYSERPIPGGLLFVKRIWLE